MQHINDKYAYFSKNSDINQKNLDALYAKTTSDIKTEHKNFESVSHGYEIYNGASRNQYLDNQLKKIEDNFDRQLVEYDDEKIKIIEQELLDAERAQERMDATTTHIDQFVESVDNGKVFAVVDSNNPELMALFGGLLPLQSDML